MLRGSEFMLLVLWPGPVLERILCGEVGEEGPGLKTNLTVTQFTGTLTP